jgi:plasmid stabilization system protein ParE
MDRKIIWTEKSSSDIETIVRYIACGDPKAAARIGYGIYERAQILLQHPEAGTVLDELCQGDWRKLIFRRWKIV